MKWETHTYLMPTHSFLLYSLTCVLNPIRYIGGHIFSLHLSPHVYMDTLAILHGVRAMVDTDGTAWRLQRKWQRLGLLYSDRARHPARAPHSYLQFHNWADTRKSRHLCKDKPAARARRTNFPHIWTLEGVVWSDARCN